ncbi:MAG TPA: hypothetical protein VMY41_19010 [Thermohalobaculum sp.]|nr:hypothetical protein [Thermohalobaculum sp.]
MDRFKTNAGGGSAIWLASEWVVPAELEWANERPVDLLNAILVILDSSPSDWELELLYTGVLEALLSYNYEAISGTVFQIARKNEDLKYCLARLEADEEYEADFEERLNALNED